MAELEFKSYIEKDVTEITSQIRTLNNETKEKKLIEQLELLHSIIKNIRFNEKPKFLPFTHDKYVFDIVSDPYELVEAFKLRFLAYSHPDVAYINPELFPLRLEFDKHDKVSTHFFARDMESDRMCGYVRMIHDTHLGLQLGINLNISDYRKKYKICEISRYITYPRGQPIVRKMLLSNLKQSAKSLGFEKILGEAPLAQMKLYTRWGGLPMSSDPNNPNKPLRTWNLSKKKEWGSKLDLTIYGNVIHLDQEGQR